MKIIRLPILFILLLGVEVQIAMGQTRLGLHVTQEELNVWRQRADGGPYKAKGDVSHNSPGDWTRILNKANSFMANPSAERWSGQTSAQCRTNTSSQPSRAKGENLRDAAFVYLVQGTPRYRDAVRNEMLAQAATPGTRFSDSARWCVNSSVSQQGLLDVAPWLTRLLFAYDWIRPSLSSTDQSVLDDWFLAAGRHFEALVHMATRKRWPNRKSNSYGSSPERYAGTPAYNIYYGAPVQDDWHLAWDNKGAVVVRTFGLIGIQQNDAALKTEAKRWFKEWLRYNVWHANTGNIATHGEYHRCCWTTLTHFPNLGWGYTSSTIGAMTVLADAFYRAGDAELYNYSTSEGYYGTHGGPKSLHSVITTHFKMMDLSLIRYGTNHASDVGKSSFIIDNLQESTGWHHIGDVWIAPIANRFYKSSYFKAIYTREAAGVSGYPASPATGGFNAWGGEQGIFPGVLFMFGDMESTIALPPSTVPAPSNLAVEIR